MFVGRVIAIDGPSGAGKSTIAKLIAKELGFAYLDTGALYRAVAFNLMKCGVKDNASDKDISLILKKTDVKFMDGTILLNGKDVSHEIRLPDVGHYASLFSAKKSVRKHLLQIQRDASVHSDLVAEGRDMTTVVFPYAYKKFYLDASVEERMKRRMLELASKGFSVDKDQIHIDIIERDIRDSNRDIAPLKKAEDACLIDSTDLSIKDVFNGMLKIIKEN